MAILSLKIPAKIQSESNIREHWSAKAKRIKRAQLLVKALLTVEAQQPIKLPCTVILERISPRPLDDDNLQSGFKHIRDIIAAFITDDYRPGRADSNPQITWIYAQSKGKPKENAFKIEIQD